MSSLFRAVFLALGYSKKKASHRQLENIVCKKKEKCAYGTARNVILTI